jgi:D-aspartate ligase
MNYNNIAVVLSLFDTGVATARSLGRLGISVEGYDYDHNMPGFRSKYCKAQLSPNPTSDAQGLLKLLLDNADRATPKILYACSDEYVLFISQYRDILQLTYKLLLPDHSLIESIIDKHKQIQLIKNLGIYVPHTYFVDSMDRIHQIIDRFEFPVFLKPIHIHVWRRVFNNKGFKAHNEEELLSVCRNIFSNNLQIIIQEIIPGLCSNNYEVSLYVGTGGNILGEFTIQKLRQYPDDLGFGTLTVSSRNREVEEISRKIIKDLNWRGYANLEFKYDPRDHTYKFIEINARVWQQINHADILGINFPLLQYLDLNDIQPAIVKTYRENIKWMDLKYDVITSFQMILKGKLSFREWINSLKGVRVFGLFAKDDLKPFLYSIKYGFFIFKIPKFLIKFFLERKWDFSRRP